MTWQDKLATILRSEDNCRWVRDKLRDQEAEGE